MKSNYRVQLPIILNSRRKWNSLRSNYCKDYWLRKINLDTFNRYTRKLSRDWKRYNYGKSRDFLNSRESKIITNFIPSILLLLFSPFHNSLWRTEIVIQIPWKVKKILSRWEIGWFTSLHFERERERWTKNRGTRRVAAINQAWMVSASKAWSRSIRANQACSNKSNQPKINSRQDNNSRIGRRRLYNRGRVAGYVSIYLRHSAEGFS